MGKQANCIICGEKVPAPQADRRGFYTTTPLCSKPRCAAAYRTKVDDVVASLLAGS
jgi:hypothetical protein